MKLRYFSLIAIVIVIAAISVSSAASQSTDRLHARHGAKPTVVLIHGAWADNSSWSRVTRRLQNQGYKVNALPNPLRGLSSDSAYVRSFLNTIAGPIVLVGHSYGGAVITNAALGDTDVNALVYVDAYVPAQGETLVGLTHPPSCFAVQDLSTVFDFVPIPGGDVDVYVKQSVFPRCLANGLSARKGALLAASQRPLATSALFEPSGVPAWMTIPSWAVIGTADRAIPAADQRTMANNAGAQITEIDAPHLSMVSDPQVVARVIIRAARETR